MNDNPNTPQNQFENRIFFIRSNYIMLDRDLAEIYQVETKALNQAVKRNSERFPVEFRFQLSLHEKNELVTSCDRLENLKHSSTNPFAFTEQGVAMLSAVLRSDIAVKVSVEIIKAFVEMRKTLQAHRGLLQRMDSFERRQLENEFKFEKIFKALESNPIPTQGLFFDGQLFDAYELASQIIRSARQSIVLIDNYIDESVLVHLAKKSQHVNVLLLSKNISRQLLLDVQKAQDQYGNFEIREFTKSHDRFLVIDGKEVFHLGASLKDLGKKWFAFSKLEADTIDGILLEIEKLTAIK